MDIVVPGDGFTVFRRLTGSSFALDALGPLSSGDLIRRVDVFAGWEGAGVLSVAVALGGSNDASEEALDAGLSLIQRSSFGAHAAQDGAPAWTAIGVAGGTARFAFYPGIRVSLASSWIVTEVGSHSGGVVVSAMVAIEIWRVRKVKEVAGAGN